MPVYGGIEAGGTKFVCAIGTGPDDVRAEARFATATPEETIGRAVAFFREWVANGRGSPANGRPASANGRRSSAASGEDLTAVGIASFGPIDPDPRSPTYGYVTTTPKPGWAHTDFAGAVGRALGVPVGFDTDVNTAALGEGRWGAARGLDTFIYLTVGTGLGGGGMVNGELIHGMMHPEMGHIRVPHDWAVDPYPGFCTYHGDCLEGLTAGPAIAERWGRSGEELPADHPAWELEARYLALGLVNYICTLSPQRIIMGGGVMDNAFLFPMIGREVQALLNGYVGTPQILRDIDRYIVPPELGARAGVLGAMALAERAAGRGR